MNCFYVAYKSVFTYHLSAEIVVGVPCEIEVFTGNQPLGITVMGGADSFQVRKAEKVIAVVEIKALYL